MKTGKIILVVLAALLAPSPLAAQLLPAAAWQPRFSLSHSVME